ncbi:hypothetical protein [Roseicella aquatilis]|uniref:Uncharacterized protein n=1 Tax=Roseicella aquatilis TaxID=2527868 RepID=A0A4R4DEF8_9PROT|nr:hypothetical protein [Roseicella aquatilis]TCZ58755.1 hypothetical protein EXY23_16215 [Roseicella aquatilis]
MLSDASQSLRKGSIVNTSAVERVNEMPLSLVRLREKVIGGLRISETEVLSAACMVSLTSGEHQRDFWNLFRTVAAAFLSDENEKINVGRTQTATARQWLAATEYEQIAHIRRKDPHLWNVCLHIVRTDGSWFVCNGRFDELIVLGGHKDEQHAFLSGRGKNLEEAEKTTALIENDIQSGFHASAGGRAPVLNIVFSNGRPIDQSVALARFDRLAGNLPRSEQVRIYQNRETAFFDPNIFPAIAATGKVEFYSPRERDVRAEALKTGASLIEAFYMPDTGWTEQNDALQHLKLCIARHGLSAAAHRDGELRVFVSLELEKRVWTEQVEGFLALFAALRERAEKVVVLVNGMTGVIFEKEAQKLMANFDRVTSEEKKVISYWQNKLGLAFSFEYLGGCSFYEKVNRIAACDFFVAPGGTAALLALLAGVPGVYYSHPELQQNFSGMLGKFAEGKLICKASSNADKAAKGMFNYVWAGVGGESYSIPVSEFLSECLANFDAAREVR